MVKTKLNTHSHTNTLSQSYMNIGVWCAVCVFTHSQIQPGMLSCRCYFQPLGGGIDLWSLQVTMGNVVRIGGEEGGNLLFECVNHVFSNKQSPVGSFKAESWLQGGGHWNASLSPSPVLVVDQIQFWAVVVWWEKATICWSAGRIATSERRGESRRE